jgi:ParB-like chromosome segregation protein Spo0J
MNIQINDIEPNPFRNLTKYPLSQEKVDALKVSIKENGFWGGILVRKNPEKKDKYQMAFGHHRYEALKQLKAKLANDTIVYDLDDDDMLHRMFAENHETWGMRPSCVLENVESARNRLNDILSKYPTWEDIPPSLVNLPSFGGRHTYNDLKTKGVGRTTILKYLGNLYTEDQVRKALNVLKETEQQNSKLSIEAVKSLPSMSHVEHFRSAVKEYEIPLKTQTKIAEKITKEGLGKREVADTVSEYAIGKIKTKKEVKPLPMLDDYIKETQKIINELRTRLVKVNGKTQNIQSKVILTAFIRDGKELLEIMKEIFENGKSEKETKKRILSESR